MPDLDPRTTALVLIDLQKGIAGRPLEPRSGDDVVVAANRLAERFRAAGAPVVLVNVAFAPDFADALSTLVDEPMPRPEGGTLAHFAELVDGLAQPSDLRITKHHWGAFHGTALDDQLRRRGIRTIVLGGIATNFGVEGTAREAWQHNYHVVVVEDATASTKAELHAMSIGFILPRLGRVTRAEDIQLGMA